MVATFTGGDFYFCPNSADLGYNDLSRSHYAGKERELHFMG